MAALHDDAKEQVRQATDIVDLAGGYMQLRRQGRNYVALCPWHEDSRPSLQINPERQSFKCWVCDLGGDVFSFMMKMENLDFREALEHLAERAGIELRQASGPRAEPGSPGDKKTLLAAMAWAEELYHLCLLKSPEADVARRYCEERGLDSDAIGRFRIGFAPPNWDWLLKQAPRAGYSPAVLERINLIAARQSGGGHYDQFRGRLLFPIRDTRSRPVAIGGRVLPELAERESRDGYKPAKYVNSSETPIYSKSNTLYALDQAKDALRREAKDASGNEAPLIVVEGYTDVIACHLAGVTNVVACCGTAMGEGHLKLVRRYAERLVLVLDGDEAGRKRASELLELFIASPIDLRILTLPSGLDPCDFVASHGGDEFARLVAQAPDALEHKLQSVTEGMVLSAENTHAASRAVEQMLATLAKTKPALGEASGALMLREESILSRLAHHFRMRVETLRARLTELRREASQRLTSLAPKAKPPVIAPTGGDPFAEAAFLDAEEAPAEAAASSRTRAADLPVWDREALEVALLSEETALRLLEEVDEVDFAAPAARALFVAFRDVSETGPATYERLMSSLEDENTKTLLVEIDERGQARSQSDADQRLNDLLLRRDRRHEGTARGQQISALRKGELPEEEADAAVAALFASKRRETGSRSTDG